MKKFLALIMLVVMAAVVLTACDDSIDIAKDGGITEFPYVTDDGHVLYQLSIEDNLMETKHYPFRYTAEYLLEHKSEKYDDLFDDEETSDTAKTTSDNKSGNETTTTSTNKTTTTQAQTTTAANTQATTTQPQTTTYFSIEETDEQCLYYPVKDVLDYYDIKYVESDSNSTLTTEINGKVLYIREGKNVLYYDDKPIRTTAPVVYNKCLYATAHFFEYFLGMESELTFDKTTAKLTKVVKEGVTQPAELTCSTCKGIGMIACPECGGDGIDSQYEILYNDDTNSTWTNPAPNERLCTHCGGSGLVVCPTCEGYGVVKNPLYKEPETTVEGETTTTEAKQ